VNYDDEILPINENLTKRNKIKFKILNEDITVFKILLIGDSGVGITNFLDLENIFDFIEFGCSMKCIEIGSKFCKLSLFDGNFVQELSHYSIFNGVLLFYDISNRESFVNLRKWLEELTRYCSEDVALVLVGNKVDIDDRHVRFEEAKEFADEFNMLYVETSAKSGEGVEESLIGLAKFLSSHQSV